MRYWPILIGLAACFAVSIANADELSTLEEQMTGEEFDRAGLEKLSRDELRFLNDWLRGRDIDVTEPAVSRAAAPARSDEPAPDRSSMGFLPSVTDRDPVYSRIDGEFEGWTGRTEFVLQNGQVWKQHSPGRWNYRATNPEVEIQPKRSGAWRIYVDGHNRSVAVIRIK